MVPYHSFQGLSFWIHEAYVAQPVQAVRLPDGMDKMSSKSWCVQVLLSSVVDCWDKLRETSISVLMSLERPLPGLEGPEAVRDLVQWARRLVGSPRVRESDAGAGLFFAIHTAHIIWDAVHTEHDLQCAWPRIMHSRDVWKIHRRHYSRAPGLVMQTVERKGRA